MVPSIRRVRAFRCPVLLAFAVLLAGVAAAQTTTRASVATGGTEENAGAGYGTISADGRFVAFWSSATNLVAGDTNGFTDVFVRDLVNGTTERVSISTGGTEGDGDSYYPVLSADGRFVAFLSQATNLVAGDTNGKNDIFVRDRQAGTTERVSISTGGTEQDGHSLYPPAISPDGRFVAFTSQGTNLVAGDTNSAQDVFLRDRQNSTTERISLDSTGTEGNGDSIESSISADGRYVAFASSASNLVAGDVNGVLDVFVRDRQAATTERVSVATGGNQGNGASYNPWISADGRTVAFASDATSLLAGTDTNFATDVFVRDRQAATTERVSEGTGGIQGNAGSGDYVSVSADLRYVVFSSTATNLVPGDTNGFQDVFIHDRLVGTTERLSLATDGSQTDGDSFAPTITADGRVVLFSSDATNLVLADTNAARDVFIRDTGIGHTDTQSDSSGGGSGNNDSFGPSVSSDGSFIAFQSNATNLVAGDTNGARDIFVHDHAADTTSRVSVDSSSTEANGDSSEPAISADGRYVAFTSVATNLVAGDSNGVSDVFVRDRQLGTTIRVSVDSSGTQANGACSHPAISADGRYVAFDSTATNLVAGDSNGARDVFVRDLLSNTTTRASVDSTGTQGNGNSSDPAISGDGRYVGFESLATNLVAGDTNAVSDVFVRDTVGLTTTRMSVDSAGVQGNASSSNAALSGDGLWVGFQSDANNLVSGDTNVQTDVFVRHRNLANTIARVNVDSGGTQGLTGGSSGPALSADGRYVAFQSDANNLVSGDTNASTDVFVHDRLFAKTKRIDVDSGGTQGLGGNSGGTSISDDGRHVGFDSFATNLVPTDTNGSQDIFLHDQGEASAFVTFCLGDGTGHACPCGNSGNAGHGCQNSATTGGSLLTLTGVASLSEDSVQLTASFEKVTALSVFLQGTTMVGPLNYGDGLRCTGGTLKRLYSRAAVGGVVVGPQIGDLSITARSTALGTPIPLGATRFYQVYYRDPNPAFCAGPAGSTFNISNAIAVTWGG